MGYFEVMIMVYIKCYFIKIGIVVVLCNGSLSVMEGIKVIEIFFICYIYIYINFMDVDVDIGIEVVGIVIVLVEGEKKFIFFF